MQECTIIPEASGCVWENVLAKQRLVDMYGRIH